MNPGVVISHEKLLILLHLFRAVEVVRMLSNEPGQFLIGLVHRNSAAGENSSFSSVVLGDVGVH